MVVSSDLGAQQDPDLIKQAAPSATFSGTGLSYQTNRFTGEFQYTYTLQLPAARGRSQPAVALNYGSSNGNGVFGVGWNFEPGFIQRDSTHGSPVAWALPSQPQTQPAVPISEYDDTVGFLASLDQAGGRLVSVGGGEYKFEVDQTFTSFVYTDPVWVAVDKSGTTYYFGEHLGSRLEHGPWAATTAGGRTYRWQLSRRVDSNGNETSYTYTTLSGQLYLSRIDYNHNIADSTPARTSLLFSWQFRNDDILDLRPGWMLVTSYRCNKISIFVDGAGVAREYDIGYEYADSTQRSRIISIQESSNGASHPATHFSYQNPLHRFSAPHAWGAHVNETTSQTGAQWNSVRFDDYVVENVSPSLQVLVDVTKTDLVDIDGDALPDRVMQKFQAPFDRFFIQFNEGAGFRPALENWLVGGGGVGAAWAALSTTVDNGSEGFTWVDLQDVNGDGYRDRIRIPSGSTPPHSNFLVEYGHGSGFNVAVPYGPIYNYGSSLGFWNSITSSGNGGAGTSLTDLDGDGRIDRVLRRSASPYHEFLVQRGASTGSTAFETQNGAALLRSWPVDSQGDNSAVWNSTHYNTETGMLAGMFDMNGDGLPDRVMRELNMTRGGSAAAWDALAVEYNRGVGFFPTQYVQLQQQAGQTSEVWSRPVNSSNGSSTHNLATLVDINGDSLPDRVMRQAVAPSGGYDRFVVQLNNGNGFGPLRDYMFASPNTQGQTGPDWNSAYARVSLEETYVDLLDVNGDGLPDRVMRRAAAPTTAGLQVALNEGPFPDLLSQIDNGVGGMIDIEYRPSTTWDNRDKAWSGDPWSQGARSLLPIVLQTVTKVTVSGGVGPASIVSYTYANGMFDPQRREFCGFNCSSETKPDGQLTKTYYHQGGGINKTSDGEFADAGAFAKRGFPYREEHIGADGLLYRVSLSKVEQANLGGGRFFPHASLIIDMDFGGFSNARYRAQAKTYDLTNGNLLSEINYGEVDESSPGSATAYQFVDIGQDARATYNAYVPGIPGNASIVDRKSSTTLYAGVDDTGQTLHETQMRYWSTTGTLKEQKDWLDATSTFISTLYDYDSSGNVTRTVNDAGVETVTAFDTYYKTYPTSVTVDPSGQNVTTVFVYDARSNALESATDSNGVTKRYVYDALYRLVESRVEPPALASVWRERVSYGLGGVTAGVSSNYVHRRVNDGVDAVNGHESFLYFDGTGKKIQTRIESESGAYRVTELQHDAAQRVVRELQTYIASGAAHQPAPSVTPYTLNEFDPVGRTSRVTPPSGDGASSPTAPTLTQYGDATTQDPWCVTKHDALGNRKRTMLDAFGHATTIIEYETVGAGQKHQTAFEYDVRGNLVSITDAHGNITTHEYDSLGRLVQTTEPNVGAWSYQYTSLGQVADRFDAKGQLVHFDYDSLGRLTDKTVYTATSLLEEHVQYEYDVSQDPQHTVHKGQLYRVTDGQGSIRYSYDLLGRTLRETRHVNQTNADYVTEYAYNENDKIVEVTYPNGTAQVRYVYDTAGHVDHAYSVYGPFTIPETFYQAQSFDELGRVTQYALGNGVTVATAFYPNSKRFQRRTASVGGNTIQDIAYTYNVRGDVTATSDLTHTGQATGECLNVMYDELGRLTEYTRNGTTYEFRYDAIGNMVSNGELAADYKYESVVGTSAVIEAGDRRYTYDANGNMITRGTANGDQDLIYDAQDRLIRVSAQSMPSAVEFGYTSDGNRVWRRSGSALTVWLGRNYEERAGKRLCHVMVDGAQVCTFEVPTVVPPVPPGAAFARQLFQYTCSDRLRSTNIVTNRSGQVTQELQYAAFGAQVYALSGTVFPTSTEFTEQVVDRETGLYYFGARYYDPEIARFIQADGIVPDYADPQSLNRYSYALNNPLRYIDPDGNSALDLVSRAATSVATLAGTLSDRIGWAMGAMTYDYSRFGAEGVVRFAVSSETVEHVYQSAVEWFRDTMDNDADYTARLVPYAIGVDAVEVNKFGGTLWWRNVLDAPERSIIVSPGEALEAFNRYLTHEWGRNGMVNSDFGTQMIFGSLMTKALPALAPETAEQSLRRMVDNAYAQVGSGRGPVYGTRVHSALERNILSLGRADLKAEVSYFGGEVVRRGFPGSVRLDAVIGSEWTPQAIFDLKTGTARLTQSRINQIRLHLPDGYKNIPIMDIR